MKKAMILLIIVVCYFQKYDYIDLNEYKSEKIQVEVKGRVVHPKTYELHYQAKVKDVIDAAGGLLADADHDRLNLNQTLHHQDVIVVAKKTEQQRVSLNSATLEELTTLNGIGPSTAQKIIDYRNQVGSFQTLEDIMKIKGIKQKLYDKIKDFITL